MTGLLQNIHLALPEIIVLVSACLALIGDLFFKQACKHIAFIIASIGLVLAAGFAYLYINEFNTVLFNGLLVSDSASQLMNLFIAVCVWFSFYYAKYYNTEQNIPQGDFYVLGLFSTLGMMTLVSSHSLLTVYLGLELVSLPLYAMTAMSRFNGNASEAALKYFVMGAIASGMLLYGMSLLYAATGQLNLHDMANAIALHDTQDRLMLLFALAFIIVGIGFKLAVIPFHMWAPDVYDGAPTSVTLFISSAPKIAAVGMALRLLGYGLIHLKFQWSQIAILIALLSTGFGSIFAIAQTNIKRMLAYSTIAHMGYVLFGILAATAAGFSAALYYVLIYAVMSLGAFGLLIFMSQRGVDITEIDDLKGLNKRNPWFAFLMMIVMFSMAGVPPTVGFFAKLLVLKALVDAQMVWLAVLGLVFAVIGGYYYLRIVKVMYFDEPKTDAPIQMNKMQQLVFSINCLALLALGICPAALVTCCVNAFTG